MLIEQNVILTLAQQRLKKWKYTLFCKPKREKIHRVNELLRNLIWETEVFQIYNKTVLE